MRNGFKIYDSDTPTAPSAETLEPYLDAAMRKRLPDWQGCKVPFGISWPARFSTTVSSPLPV